MNAGSEIPILQADGLTRRFGHKTALADFSLTLRAGEIFGLVGPDGAGKTTALRLLSGGIQLHGGSIRICGQDMAHHPERARACLGYLSQRFSLYADLTVAENLRFFAEVRGLPAEAWQRRGREMLAFVGLAPFTNRRAGLLSGGMKQKLSLAVALINQPSLLLLDEPTTGVDPVTRQDFWQLILRLAAEGRMAVLVTTPYMDEASRCSRVGFLQQGRLVSQGTPDALRHKLDGRVLTASGQPEAELAALAATLPGVQAVQRFGDRIHLRLQPSAAASVQRALEAQAAAAGIRLELCQPIEPGLEDVFIALTEGDA